MRIENRERAEKLIRAHREYENLKKTLMKPSVVKRIYIETVPRPNFVLGGNELYADELIDSFREDVNKILLKIEKELMGL